MTDSHRAVVASIEAEYQRYKALAEGAMRQARDEELVTPGPGEGSPVATIVWHVAGNLASRFTDFLTTDGEKPWRRRDEEFAARRVTRDDLLARWERGWAILLESLAGLRDQDLTATVTIRGQALAVHEALHRSLAHTAYHVGQIVYLVKGFRAGDWSSLSIPPGQSAAYAVQPMLDTPAAHGDALEVK